MPLHNDLARNFTDVRRRKIVGIYRYVTTKFGDSENTYMFRRYGRAHYIDRISDRELVDRMLYDCNLYGGIPIGWTNNSIRLVFERLFHNKEYDRIRVRDARFGYMAMMDKITHTIWNAFVFGPKYFQIFKDGVWQFRFAGGWTMLFLMGNYPSYRSINWLGKCLLDIQDELSKTGDLARCLSEYKRVYRFIVNGRYPR